MVMGSMSCPATLFESEPVPTVPLSLSRYQKGQRDNGDNLSGVWGAWNFFRARSSSIASP